MRSALFTIVALSTCLAAPSARAQYANTSVSLGTGGLKLDGILPTVGWGLPVAIQATRYIENHFEAVAQIGILVAHDSVSDQNALVLDGPSLGVRYLFSEERLRPYLGLDLVYLRAFGLPTADLSPTDANTHLGFIGLGASAGADYFLNDQISVGVRGRANGYVTLNQAWAAFGMEVKVSTVF